MLGQRGLIAEEPVANVFIVQDNRVITPSTSAGILENITRCTVIEILSHNKIPIIECDITPYDVIIADEIFLSGTHAETVPICEYNGCQLPGTEGKNFQFVHTKFFTLTHLK